MNLVTANSELLSVLAQMLHVSATSSPTAPVTAVLQKQLDQYVDRASSASVAFAKYVSLAPLATADNIVIALQAQAAKLQKFHGSLKDLKALEGLFATMNALQVGIQTAGRKDLWGESEPRMEIGNL